MGSRSLSRFPPHAPRCLARGACARSTSGRAGPATLPLSTESAGRPSRFRGTQGVLSHRYRFRVQAFRLQGLSQFARAKAPCPSRSSLGQRRRKRRHYWGVCALQIFSDMQRELVLMTKPKHKNVLMVHGMYALGALGSRSAGPFRPRPTLSRASACAAPRPRRTCCWRWTSGTSLRAVCWTTTAEPSR